MKLSLARVIELDRGIKMLDAGHEVTVDGKSTRRPYRYGATVHFPLQQNALALLPHVEAYSKASKALFAEVAEPYTDEKGGPSQRVPTQKLAEYQEQIQKLLDQVVQVKLYRIKLTDLKVGTGENENPIAVGILTDLRAILLDDVARDSLVEVTDEPTESSNAKA